MRVCVAVLLQACLSQLTLRSPVHHSCAWLPWLHVSVHVFARLYPCLPMCTHACVCFVCALPVRTFVSPHMHLLCVLCPHLPASTDIDGLCYNTPPPLVGLRRVA